MQCHFGLPDFGLPLRLTISKRKIIT